MDRGIFYGNSQTEDGIWGRFCPVPCNSIEFLVNRSISIDHSSRETDTHGIASRKLGQAEKQEQRIEGLLLTIRIVSISLWTRVSRR
jgi:hypothetical protein